VTDRTPSATLTLTALVPCRTAAGISETLLSLAAQTSADFETFVIVEDGSATELGEVADLVATFDEEFCRRVHAVAMERIGSGTPVAFGAARSKATYITAVYPDDVVFAHWAETFTTNALRADGRAMASMVAAQAVETATWGDERIVTTVERPRFPDPRGFDLMEHLASPPLSLRGWAVPRLMAQRVLVPGIRAAAEGWTLRLAAALSCGVLETGEVTYLYRTSQAGGPTPIDEEWERDRNLALETLDRLGLTLAPGALQSLRSTPGQASVHRLEEELDLLRGELGRVEETARHQAAAEAVARQRVAELLSSASWKASAPLRALGGTARRLRRKPPAPG
jgi:hypothetical protein